MINYQTLSVLSAGVCLVLFGIFLVAPDAYSAGYGGPSDAGAAFIGRRAAPLFLGLAAFCWLLRDHDDQTVRRAVSVALALTFLGIAATGVWTYLQGDAGTAILFAAVGETALALAFLTVLRKV